MEERPPPEITVRDPSRTARPAEVLVSGEDELRPSPFSTRRLQALGAVVLVVAAALGVVEVRERRTAAKEERRMNRVLDLSVESGRGGSRYDISSRMADLDLQLEVRNDGPRDVVVERATIGAYVLVTSLVPVPAGGQAQLLLRRTVTCWPASPPAVQLDGVQLDLRTAAGPRSVSLPFDPEPVRDHASRACGFVPLGEAVDVQLLGVARPAGALELALDLSSRAVRPVTLITVDAGPGLRAQTGETDRGPAVLPLALTPSRRDGIRRGTYLELRVTVVDCAEGRAARPQLQLRVIDDLGRIAQPTVDYDPAVLGSLLSTSCPA